MMMASHYVILFNATQCSGTSQNIPGKIAATSPSTTMNSFPVVLHSWVSDGSLQEVLRVIQHTIGEAAERLPLGPSR
jgi:hypothetical protein